MNLPSDAVRALLAKRRAERVAKAAAVDGAAEIAKLCAEIRAWYYPSQGTFVRSRKRRKATLKNRRSGATTGGCREFLCRALEQAGYREVYCADTRDEAKKRAWKTDTQGGLTDLLKRYGRKVSDAKPEKYVLAGIEVEVREQDLQLEFSNGSNISIFTADHESDHDKLRGLAKHVIWIDEAQGFRLLDTFYKAVVVGCLTDFRGECWLTGTPSRDCAGMFYEVTKEDGDRLAGWTVYGLSVTENPFFGATPEERWENSAGEAIRENKWAPDDPDLLREWFARWVKTDARFVYAANAVAEHVLCFAPQRFQVDGFPDVQAALRDLPARVGRNPREYFLALGADLGTRAAFAFVLWAWSLRDPVLYEVCSWKRPGLIYDEMAAHLHALRRQAHIGLVVADAGGGGKPAVMGWSRKWVERYQLPIAEATKTNKAVSIAQLNNDIRNGLVKLRKGSPLLAEWKVHRWKAMKSETGGLVEEPSSRRDCSDAGLYAHRESYHHRFRDVIPPLKPRTAEAYAKEAAEMEAMQYDVEADEDQPYH